MSKFIDLLKKIDSEIDEVCMGIYGFLKNIPKYANWFLSQRFWNGLGTLVVIGVAIMIFILSQQWQEARYKETLANIQLNDVDIINPIEEMVM